MRSARCGSPDERSNLYGLDRDGLAAVLARFGAPGFHSVQIFRWLYGRRALDPATWTDLPSALRDRLATETRLDPGSIAGRVDASDGTVKFRVRLAGGGAVEAVSMVQSGRVTLCLSSQVGCALDCDFCLTGKMGFVRHLDPGEIVGQVALIQQALAFEERPFSVVFMGMGEPLHNYEAVTAAVRLLAAPTGFGLSRQRITVSTSGMVPGIERLATEAVRPRLAVSLNATTDVVRDRIMPINHKYDLACLLDACRRFADTTGERFTFEYVLLAGINDALADVSRLATLTRGLRCKVNLIPFNPVPGHLAYRPPERERVIGFRDGLLGRGVRASIRWSRGAEARAACGQLALLEPPDVAGGGPAGD